MHTKGTTMDIDKIKRYYDHVLSQVYAEDESPMHEQITAEVWHNIIAKLDLPKDSNILDVGCGPGYFLELCKANGYKNVSGTVGTEAELEALNKKKLKARIEDISFLSDKDGSLDFIFCRQVLEHSPWPYITLLEYNRVLKMGGRIYIEVPIPDSDNRKHEQNVNHYSVMGVRMLHNLVVRAGFKIDNPYNLKMPIKDMVTEEKGFEEGLALVASKAGEIDD